MERKCAIHATSALNGEKRVYNNIADEFCNMESIIIK
jgi:hypothetical protein